jgi:hypothetical protein
VFLICFRSIPPVTTIIQAISFSVQNVIHILPFLYSHHLQGCGVGVGVVESELDSESEGILGGVGVRGGKNVPSPNPTSM